LNFLRKFFYACEMSRGVSEKHLFPHLDGVKESDRSENEKRKRIRVEIEVTLNPKPVHTG